MQAIQTALALAERRFQATFHNAPVGIAHVGMDGSFLLVNARFCEITGYCADALMRSGFQQITHADDLRADEALLARLNRGEIPRYSMEKRYIRLDGAIVWINLTVSMMRDEDGEPELYVAVVEDLSEVRKAHHESTHDPLTGLRNRRGFADRAQAMIDQAVHAWEPVSLVYLDLDGFKMLNDRFGHEAGDQCLIDVGTLLKAYVRPMDVAARIGGDEFVLLLSGLTDDAATELVERLRVSLSQLVWMDDVGVSGSFGLLTTVPTADTDLAAMIRRADGAMLQAKRAGRNQVVLAG
ncbi:GGDEF domain-containing protein [Sphingobium aromaticiconvertens]|uniref:GGDEF domain-containing protein n=1 Tax=Sphingobium aromaticiconvertens TaxID=365341 RepID=UPI003017B732